MSDDSLSKALHDLGDNVGKLLGEHVSLAEAELKREGEKLLLDLLWALLGVAWTTVGYCLLMGALILGLRHWLGVGAAAVLVGCLNLGAGAWTLLVVTRRLRWGGLTPLPILEGELRKDGTALADAAAGQFRPVGALSSHQATRAASAADQAPR